MSSVTNGEYQPTDEDIRLLRECLKKMPHILQDYDDAWLATFIRGSKGNLEVAKIRLEKFNASGFEFPELFGHLDVYNKTTQKCLEETILFTLPKQLECGGIVFVIGTDFQDTKSKLTNLFEIWRYWRMAFFVSTWERIPNSRSIIIFDWKNLRLGHGKGLTPAIASRLVESVKCIPGRMQVVYYLNFPPAFEWVVNIGKTLVKKKVGDRFHLIKSIDTLHKYIPREILPKDYGGDEDDIKTLHSRWKKKIESYRDRLVEENNKMRKLDPLRPTGKGRNDAGETFKVLNVD